MALRTDIWIDWDSSPRIVWIPSPSTTVTVQDIIDTVRVLEAEITNMAFPKILDATGKDVISATANVGITCTLRNATVAFGARPGPTYIGCIVTDGNLLATDINGDPMSPIYPTAFTQITISQSTSATLVTTTTGSGLDSTQNTKLTEIYNQLTAIESGFDHVTLMRLFAAVLAGKVSGAGTGIEVFRDINDTKPRVTSTVDENGNRTAITVDGT